VKMDVSTFIAHAKAGTLPSVSVFCFTGRANQPTFFSRLLGSGLFNASAVDVTATDPVQARAQLATTFLGKRQFFWLSSLQEAGVAVEKRWLEYLKKYAGPNTVALFLSDEKKIMPGWAVVTVTEKKDLTLLNRLAVLFGSPLTDEQLRVIGGALRSWQALSLDTMVLLIDYVGVAGESLPLFLSSSLQEVVASDVPFFELSGFFFARDVTRFFDGWRRLGTQYQPQFWLTLWSEQLFRAYFYVLCRKEGRLADAKRISWRLPFSFTQRDWKQYESEVLRSAHHRLTNLDHELKNGSSQLGLDLFLVRFMASRRAC